MSAAIFFRPIASSLLLIGAAVSLASLICAQLPTGGMDPGRGVAVTIAVRDLQGAPPEIPATVRLYSPFTGYEVSSLTVARSDAVPPHAGAAFIEKNR